MAVFSRGRGTLAELAALHAFCTQSPGGNAMPTRIKPKRYATLQTLLPPEGEGYPISQEITVQELQPLFPALSPSRSARCPIFSTIGGYKSDLIFIF